jgi:hypothetical protein
MPAKHEPINALELHLFAVGDILHTDMEKASNLELALKHAAVGLLDELQKERLCCAACAAALSPYPAKMGFARGIKAFTGGRAFAFCDDCGTRPFDELKPKVLRRLGGWEVDSGTA